MAVILVLPLLSAGQDWSLIKAFQPSQSLHSIRFADNHTGWTVSSLYNGSTYNIHKTEDGGETWTDQSSGHTATRFKDIWVVSEDTVFMCGNFGLVIHTFDGGNTWLSDTVVPSGDHLFGIWFADETGYVCGNSGAIYKTTDLGATWLPVTPPFITAIEEICFLDEDFGFICGLNFIYYTEDGGNTWVEPETFPGATTNWWLREFSFTDTQTGFVCGDIGQVYKTTDAGKNWEFLPNTGTSESLQSIFALDEDHIYACGFAGTVIRSEDGGTSWAPMTAASTQIFFSMDFTPEGTGFICTWSGEVLRYTSPSTGILNEGQKKSITLYPNPVTDRLHLSFPGTGDDFKYYEKVVIYSTSGKEVASFPVRESLDLAEFAPGPYVVVLSGPTTKPLIQTIIKN